MNESVKAIVRHLTCALCLEEYNDHLDSYRIMSRFSIGCDHKFHLPCFERYVITRRFEDTEMTRIRLRSCPVCRQHISVIRFADKSVTVQQFLEQCAWKQFKRKHCLKNKEDGMNLVIDHVNALLDKGVYDKQLHDDYSIILGFLSRRVHGGPRLINLLRRIAYLETIGIF